MHSEFDDVVNIRKVDCTNPESADLCSQMEVRGYPSLMLFKGGKYYEFSGPRNKQGFVEFATNDGYLKADADDQGDIPERLFGISKYVKSWKSSFGCLTVSLVLF